MSTQPTSKTPKISKSYCRFGAETLLNRLEGLEDLIAGVKENTDIEFVHKTRVTSRRLRAALPLFCFCFPTKAYEGWMEEIKKVTRLLADARDLDVQIAFVEQYTKKLSSPIEQTAMGILLRAHKNRRKRIQPSVVAGLDELQKTKVLSDIGSLCEKIITDNSSNIVESSAVLEKAYWQISRRLDNFLSMEKCVYLEKEKLLHHQMRICAKKLRYTMECFAPLYGDKLKVEIETIKEFQDVLGEMHDCDVWIEYLPNFRAKINSRRQQKTVKNQINQALLNFSTYVKERRRKFYRQFIDLWEKQKESDFFNLLRKTTSKQLITAAQNRANQALKNPKVKIAVLSDVHANLQALQAVIADAEKRNVEVFLNAGDSIGFGANPNEVVRLLSEKNVLSIVGNYDLEVLEGRSDAKGEKKLTYKFTRKELIKPSLGYLKALTQQLRLETADKKILIAHGSPESIEEHILQDTPDSRLEFLGNKANANLVIVGHSHKQLQRKVSNAVFVNPGSVGRPGDGNPQTGYAIITFDPFNVELIRLDYDVESAAEALRKKGLPESYSQMLLRGKSLEAVINEDKSRANLIVKNWKDTVKASEDFAVSCWPDVEHYRQVTNLTLGLFDELSVLHKLGKRERCWLECAAILHDIGLSKSSGKHHKQSAKLILNNTSLPLASKDRRVIASIARYHRKEIPKLKHYNLAPLDRLTVHKVSVLASLLRVADSLDYSHASSVKILGIKVGAKRVMVECVSRANLELEKEAFDKKKNLFEKLFAKKMVLTWKQQ